MAARNNTRNGNRAHHPMYQDQYANGLDRDSESSPRNLDYRAMTSQQLEARRQQEFANQDAALDQIHRGAKGLKNHAIAINGEVVEQNVMIDDVSTVSFQVVFLKRKDDPGVLTMCVVCGIPTVVLCREWITHKNA